MAIVFVSADLGDREPLKGFKQGSVRGWCVFQSKTDGGNGKGGLGQGPLRIAVHSSADCIWHREHEWGLKSSPHPLIKPSTLAQCCQLRRK